MENAVESKIISVFNYLSKAVAKETNMDSFIRDFVRRLPSLMHCDAGWVHLADAQGVLTLIAHEGCTQDSVRDMARLEPEKCLIGKVYASGRPIVVKDASSDLRVTHIKTVETGLRSMASVPMSSSGKVLGVLSIASRESGYFGPLDMKILSAAGNQLGVAIENSRLIEQLHKRMKQIETINEVSSSINSSLSIGTLFRIMVSEVRKLVGFDRASLLLYDEKQSHLLILALETRLKTVMPKGVWAPLEGTSAGWVVRHNQPYINQDLRLDIPFPLDKKLYDEGIRSTISIPLSEDKVIGVFNLDSIEPNKYSTEDLQLLLTVSKHISIALENTLLFEKVSRDKREWEKTFDAISDMVWTDDINGQVVRANQALLDRAGLSQSGLRGMKCRDLLARVGIDPAQACHDEDNSAGKQTFKEIKEHTQSVYHYWTYPLMDEAGGHYCTVHYLKDVTGQKQLEQQVIRNDKLASLGILVAGIAHEINNPLGIIAGYAEALLDRAQDKALLSQPQFEDFPEYLDTIHKEIFRCKEILGSLLEFARPHTGKTRMLDINELIKEVMLLVKHKARTLNYDLTLKLRPGLPKVLADPGGLRQLFMNVIINAMYHTPEGGEVQIWTGMDGHDGSLKGLHGHKGLHGKQMLSIRISDTGSGIPEDIIERIFDPFFTTKPTGVGAGLGLSICHRIAEEHGGLIEVKSKPGKGSTFIIHLPAATTEAVQAAEATAEPAVKE